MTKNQKISEKGQSQLQNISNVVKGVALVGAISGVIYSYRSGGGFLRGIGYFFLGSMIFGGATKLITLPMTNKIISEQTNK